LAFGDKSCACLVALLSAFAIAFRGLGRLASGCTTLGHQFGVNIWHTRRRWRELGILDSEPLVGVL
jgi:hypothetical protein